MSEIKRQRLEDTLRHERRCSCQGGFNCTQCRVLHPRFTMKQTPYSLDRGMAVVMLSIQRGNSKMATLLKKKLLSNRLTTQTC